MTANIANCPTAAVASTGSSATWACGTTKKNIASAGKSMLPMTAIGMRTVSRNW